MWISPNLTFRYQFAVGGCQSQGSDPDTAPQDLCWTGEGSGQAYFGKGEGIVGPKPRFEWRAGWLNLFPSGGWTQCLPVRWFSDVDARLLGDLPARWLEAQKEALKDAASQNVKADFAAYRKASAAALADALRRRGLTRDLAGYSVFVGEALGRTLQIGDEFKISRNGNGDFQYSVVRNSELVLSAGAVEGVDNGGPIAVWQEYDRHPNPDAEAAKIRSPNMRVAEWIDVHKPYVSVRVKEQMFHLLDGEDMHVDPYYAFVARSNKNAPAIAFGPKRLAVHSAGFLGALSKELIIDAARQLVAPSAKALSRPSAASA